MRNAIESLQLDSGEWLSTDEQIEQHILGFYQKLFSSDGEEVELYANIIDQKLNEELKLELMKEFSNQEIIDALEQMHPWKAAGPDGLLASFYQRYWGIVGKVVKEMALSVLNGGANLAIEMFHWLEHRSEQQDSFLALKLDMSKAYDRVEWKFLEYMLHATDFFKPMRGLHQGDPLSPYLFISCTEGLSSLIRKMERQGLWSGIKMGREGPSISYLIFVDDSLFFAKADERSIQAIMEVLQIYGKASGQKVNFKNLGYIAIATCLKKHKQLCGLLGVQDDDGKGVYLGLSYMSAYHLARTLQRLEEDGEGASSSSNEKSFWLKIWNLNIPPKEVWSRMGMLKAICKPAASNFKDWFDCFLKVHGKEIA
nr:uncharacterized protein LOC113693191 [Coffea arabica]